MRTSIMSAARTSSAVGSIGAHRTAFVCRECSKRTAPVAPAVQQRGYARAKENWTDKLRKSIWRGEAPGPKNVYGEPKLFPNKKATEIVEQDDGDTDLVDAKRDTREGLTVEQAQEQDPEYVPAERWEGLEKIGGKSGWWEKPWDMENPFVSFRKTKTPQDFDEHQLFALLRQAYIEAEILYSTDPAVAGISNLPEGEYLPFQQANISSRDGVASVDSIPTGWRENIERLAMESVGDTADVTNKTGASKNSAKQAPSPASLDAASRALWLSLPLQSLPLRFAVVKRVVQLTGARISDANISDIKTLEHLLKQVQYRDPPKDTATVLQSKADLVTLPNVHVYKKRQTWIDKEKHSGRYKVITKQLEEQGLPVPGRRRRSVN